MSKSVPIIGDNTYRYSIFGYVKFWTSECGINGIYAQCGQSRTLIWSRRMVYKCDSRLIFQIRVTSLPGSQEADDRTERLRRLAAQSSWMRDYAQYRHLRMKDVPSLTAKVRSLTLIGMFHKLACMSLSTFLKTNSVLTSKFQGARLGLHRNEHWEAGAE